MYLTINDKDLEMSQKSIADHVADVLMEYRQENIGIYKPDEAPSIMWGDVGLFDKAAKRCRTAESLFNIRPSARHQRILAALDRECRRECALFEKFYRERLGGHRGPDWRLFTVNMKEWEARRMERGDGN